MPAEIEVKYRVSDLPELLAAFADRSILLSAPVEQDDQAYAPHTWSPGEDRIGVTFCRLRTQAGRCTFTTKTPVDNTLACQEYESEVADRQQMHEAILAMGYRPTERVLKTRRTGRIGSWSLCVDDLPGVGAFLEVEAVADHADNMLVVQAELARWVDQLGTSLERVSATYDQLVAAAVPA